MPTQLEITRVGSLITFSGVSTFKFCFSPNNSSVILFYDHLLTFPKEVHHFWRRPYFNLGRVLFFAVRYPALCVHTLGVVQSFMNARPGNDPLCIPVQICMEIGLLITQLFSSAIMTMRVYALYEKSRLVLASLCIVALAIMGFSFWIFFPDPPEMVNSTVIMSCTPFINAAMSTMCSSADLAVAWGGKLVFDTIIFILTVCKSYGIGRVDNYSLIDILLRDGSMYFAIISGANVISVIILMRASAPYRAVTGLLSNSLTAIMVSRLALNLQTSRLERSSDSNLMTTAIPLEDLPSSMNINDSDLCAAHGWDGRARPRILR